MDTNFPTASPKSSIAAAVDSEGQPANKSSIPDGHQSRQKPARAEQNAGTVENLRELDAWIAEHVFGIEAKAVGFKIIDFRYPGHQGGYRIKDYSTDLAAAMEVLKKCAVKFKRDGYNSITILAGCQEGREWIVQANTSALYAFAETLELAIARFSKKLFS